ncbi:MAG: glycoside hydrolase family 2 sugar binding protein [Phycisphaerales bacterium]|nr:glycoside hydrolase family 2 sugar binding protein [Phycisphaerales bacterium]
MASRVVAGFLSLLIAAALARAEDISTSAWRLWPDREAVWKDDVLFLPSEANPKLPVNPPTGGWGVLDETQGIPVTLPSTVEEHFWGQPTTRPYALNEAQRGPKTSFPNGNYLGVSWWWRTIKPPAFKSGQRVVLTFRGARLRAEVYCNGKLCGYTIMTELPFTADVTDALIPGQPAQVAVRITNPGGHLDWIDFGNMRFKWGKYTLPPSHGFGGLDANIQMDVRDDVSVTDVAAINTPDLKKVRLSADITGIKNAYRGPVHFEIRKGEQIAWTGDVMVAVEPGGTAAVGVDATIAAAEPWDVDHPTLYRATARLDTPNSGKDVEFGFRFFTAEGIGGDDAKLTLNGKRIVLLSSISWGYWGRNGLWPDQAMAKREVAAAKAFGLNCLQFHRNIGKPAVLDVQDRVGLLRSEEPGGGKFILGTRYTRGPFDAEGNYLGKDDGIDMLHPPKEYKYPTGPVDTSGTGSDGDAQVFWEKYEEEKILAMVKRDRSHPSLILYTIQNEASDMDVRNPRIYRVLRKMHALDPSRPIVFYSGGVPKDGQVLMLPYSETIQTCTKDTPFAGWRDVHTCGGPLNYTDSLYKNADHYATKQPDEARKMISMWGEMLGSGSPDDYDTLVHSFDAAHATGYELADAKQVLAGYHALLDKYDFRQAFPTDSSLFCAIGDRSYYFWQRVIGQARADDTNDALVISGWESTTIDNHSGLLDNHRFYKGDPRILAASTAPDMLFIQPRHMIAASNAEDAADVFLVNQTRRAGPYRLMLTARMPDGSSQTLLERTVEPAGGDRFGQLIAAEVKLPTETAGLIGLTATFTPTIGSATPLTRTDEYEVIDLGHAAKPTSIAVAEPDNEVADALQDWLGHKPMAFLGTAAATKLDTIVLATKVGSPNLFERFKPAKDDTIGTTHPDFALTPELLDDALRRVKDDGTRLVFWSDSDRAAEGFARQLADRKVVRFDGMVGSLNAPWFGSWNFVRRHWALDGLPVDGAVDWRYGIACFGGPEWLKEQPKGSNHNGLRIDAPGIEVFMGFGADHNSIVGAAGCVIPYGRGQIVLYCLPQLVRGLRPGNFAIGPIVSRKLLITAVGGGR